jgi:hypothetical protein
MTKQRAQNAVHLQVLSDADNMLVAAGSVIVEAVIAAGIFKGMRVVEAVIAVGIFKGTETVLVSS